jgi:hypothetical protein
MSFLFVIHRRSAMLLALKVLGLVALSALIVATGAGH